MSESKRTSRSPRSQQDPWVSGPCAVRFQSALYTYHRGDYSVALPEFEKLGERFLRSGEFERYIECSIYILRLLAEREEFQKVAKIESKILSLIAERGEKALDAKLRSRVQYVLGVCQVYRGNQHELAINKFHASIQAAVESHDRSALAWPLYGAATVLYARNRFDDALKELEKLRTLLGCFPIPELDASSNLLRALILRNSGQLDEALKAGWQAFESLREQPHLVLYLHTLATIGTIFHAKGESLQARLYLELAERSLRREEFPRIAKIIDEAMAGLGAKHDADFDLRFEEEEGTLIESRKGEIRFEGQFLLRDLLKVFLRSRGKPIKKEELVKQVWGEVYNPSVHDNKIYVNIKRLRRLIEAEDGSTEYILRGKQGYFLNPKTRVVLVEKSTP